MSFKEKIEKRDAPKLTSGNQEEFKTQFELIRSHAERTHDSNSSSEDESEKKEGQTAAAAAVEVSPLIQHLLENQ